MEHQLTAQDYLNIIKTNEFALGFVPPEIKNSKDFFLKAINATPKGDTLYRYIPEVFSNDRDIILTAVKKHGSAIIIASENLKDDKEIVLHSLKTYSALRHASEKLRDDKEVALCALSINISELVYVSERLRDDKEIILYAVKKKWKALEFASNRLKNDKEVVLEALKKSSFSTNYLLPELKAKIGNNDPIKYLEALMLQEELNKQLSDLGIKPKSIKV